MRLSIIVPAYNEQLLLGETLGHIKAALAPLGPAAEIIVVDNESTDETPSIAAEAGARVISETVRNIGRVRNAGAAAALGEVLVFIDADTFVPETLFGRINEAMQDTNLIGGAVAVRYAQFEKRWMDKMIGFWDLCGRLFNLKPGAAQFCRKSVFRELGGFDESIFYAEDVEFYWRLTRFAKQRGRSLLFMEEPAVMTSSRRFDKMPWWKIMFLTHPVYVFLNAKRASAWKDWYANTVR